MAEAKESFHQRLEALGASHVPLSVRLDVDHVPAAFEVKDARGAVGHVMADGDVRSRLASLKVEPLVRASAILLEDIKHGKAPRLQKEIAESVCEYLDLLDGAFGATPSVLNNRGVARSFAGDLAGAAADVAAARRLAPGFEAARANEIMILRKKGDHAHLEKVASEIEAADPGNSDALRAIIDAKMALGRDRGEVLAVGERLRRSKGARSQDILTVGMIASEAGKDAEAERHLRDYIKEEPKDAEGHVRLATALLTQGKFEEALAEYEGLTEIDGPKHEYLLAIALIYDQMDRVSDADAAFDFALEHASAKDQEIIEHAFAEFRERRGMARDGMPLAPPPAAPPPAAPPPAAPPPAALPPAPAPLPGPFEKEEEDLTVPGEGTAETPDLDTDDYAPRTVGDAELFGIPTKEEQVFPAPAPEAPPAPEVARAPPPPPPPPPPAPEPAAAAPVVPRMDRDEQIAAALGASTGDAEAGSEIMGEPEEAPAARREPEPEPEVRVFRPPPPDAEAPEDAPRPREAIVPAPPQAIVAEPPPPPQIEPTVSAPARPAHAEPRPLLAPRPSAPVVSAPPPAPPEALDEDLTAELEALASSSAARADESPAEPEPFRRPTFDVDQFMAALEKKTKPVFDTLYDGLMEARRKEGPAPAATASLYESAPPAELPSVQSPPAPAARGAAPPPAPEAPAQTPPSPPEPVHTAEPVMPALFASRARDAVRQAHGPADPELLERAHALAASGDPIGAEKLLDSFLLNAPDSGPAWNFKGDLRERAGDEAAAVEAYRRAVKCDTGLKEAWNNLGVLLHVMGRLEEAVQTLQAAVKANPDDRHLWHNLGSTYHELGKLREALAAFGRAIEIDPQDRVSHNNRGTTLYELGDFKGARESFERAAAIDPTFEQAQNNLGRALEKLEDREGAVKSFEAALAANSGSKAALKNLARVLRALGRASDAAEAESRLAALGT